MESLKEIENVEQLIERVVKTTGVDKLTTCHTIVSEITGKYITEADDDIIKQMEIDILKTLEIIKETKLKLS